MTTEVAKRVIDDFDAAISKRASEAYPDLSGAQAFAKFVTTDPAGKEMLKASLRARTVTQSAQDFVPRQKAFGPNGEELNRLVHAMAGRGGLTMAESYSRVITDPRHAKLVAAVRAEEAKATAAVRDTRAPIRNAVRAYSRSWQLGSQR
jgi:hypothetical protein